MMISKPHQFITDYADKYLSQYEAGLRKKIAASERIISSQKNIIYDSTGVTNDTCYNKASVFSFIKNFFKNKRDVPESSILKLVDKFEIEYKDVNEIDYAEILSKLESAQFYIPNEGYNVSACWLTEIDLLLLEYKEAFTKIFTLKKIRNFLRNLVNEICKKRDKTYRACSLKLTTISYLNLLFSLKRDDLLILEINQKFIINNNPLKYENKYYTVYSAPSAFN